MSNDHEETASLRMALTNAARARDEALAEIVGLQERWQNERREEQHRLRNMFSVIRTVARRTRDDVATVEDYCGVLDGRLRSYLHIQAAIAQEWHKGTDLALLIAGEMLAFNLREGEGVELSGPSISLTSRAAGLLALAFHELASAAIMSGRLEGNGGSLRVSWSLDGEKPEQFLLIDWIENGSHLGDHEETQSSWAEWVEQAIAHQLAGTMRTDLADSKRLARIILPSSTICQQQQS